MPRCSAPWCATWKGAHGRAGGRRPVGAGRRHAADCTLRWAWRACASAHRDDPRFAVIAYGKLGGKELGYGSDLDVVFLYDDTDEPDPDRAQEVYGAFVRKLITWLTLRTAAGELFDIDTALRPNGNSGLLVTSPDSLRALPGGRGSNTAWTWEHQAITRARFCAGCTRAGGAFRRGARAVLTARATPPPAREVLAMREKVRAARPVRGGRFDVKHSAGGMMDVEFAVQYLVLAHSAAHPRCWTTPATSRCCSAPRPPACCPRRGPAAADAYRELRRAQHRRAWTRWQRDHGAPDQPDS
jgi:glutamate-ammonia-ligase adenylyltransferase